jgi:5-methylcytosine-specific restriction endonuclease McrA
MTWKKTDADRRRDAAVYGNRDYQRNRKAVLRRANGRCEQCGSRRALQVDHVIPISQGGTHNVNNLQVLCSGPGSCHAKKTATEGKGFRASRRADPDPRPSTDWLADRD